MNLKPQFIVIAGPLGLLDTAAIELLPIDGCAAADLTRKVAYYVGMVPYDRGERLTCYVVTSSDAGAARLLPRSARDKRFQVFTYTVTGKE